MSKQTGYYTVFEHTPWRFYIAATNLGLCFVGSMPASKEECLNWTSRFRPDYVFEENSLQLSLYLEAFSAYLSGQVLTIDVPLDLTGTPFQQKIWEALRHIPYGETVSYSELASQSGLDSKAARAVGTAVGKNPLLIVYPCHRVLTKNGKLGGYRGSLPMKEQLLKLEQLTFKT
ncbi:Methylated-DNA--protein-cysteine methyltransferase [Alkalibacterium sp. AK22]|uniref:methylated-DNA--[protein]-cysteine S-methyltransferase n=1 Tax=Alkalibacterium sp. AK22 TaxID=1229520 RepID=UPI00044F2378|nr:methylated-DNA--[protein]-cysteine S-methyltransferase [Alkalibacterium sp. AK22]EXJ24364.1 Methylated-DNA--protein-cysteine methyltransferase [Alkalibacterium sp. AK22]